MNQKWINEDGMYFPVTGETAIHENPGSGIFNVEASKNDGSRIGLRRIDDKFSFNFKIYDLGCEDIFNLVERHWDSPAFQNNGGNLGVIFNGIKGTGKTIAAKLLCNRMQLPVLLVNGPAEGLVDFIQSIEFKCVILVDEAEKTFCDEDDELLRMIESVYSKSSKLFILTTNDLSINENLIGRPGRIRYVKQFNNLSAKAINDYLDDNLADQSNRESILKLVDILEISTIDILKSIVEEVNLLGNINEDSLLNIPKANIRFDILEVCDERIMFDETKSSLLGKINGHKKLATWLLQNGEDGQKNYAKARLDSPYTLVRSIEVNSRKLYTGLHISENEVIIDGPDENGFFVVKNNYIFNSEKLYVELLSYDYPSLYKDLLIKK